MPLILALSLEQAAEALDDAFAKAGRRYYVEINWAEEADPAQGCRVVVFQLRNKPLADTIVTAQQALDLAKAVDMSDAGEFVSANFYEFVDIIAADRSVDESGLAKAVDKLVESRVTD